EEGIRIRNVTGVQTCALPIWRGARSLDTAMRMRLRGLFSSARSGGGKDVSSAPSRAPSIRHTAGWASFAAQESAAASARAVVTRSVERRVGIGGVTRVDTIET